MPGSLQAVPGTNTIYATMQATIPRPMAEDCDLWDVRFAMRSQLPRATPERGWSFLGGRWPASSGFISDPAYPCSLMLNGDLASGPDADFEPRNVLGVGNASAKYIMGQCKRATGEALAGATIQCFRTADDALESEAISADDGRFECVCPKDPTGAHYLVAYYASGNLAGTTVNTLIPTWRDGTV